MIEIKSSERKDNKKGKWLIINYLNEKGEEKTTNVFDSTSEGRAIIEQQFKGPGKYQDKWAQNGKYWNLSSLEVLSLNGNGNGNGHAPTPAPVSVAGAQASRHALRALVAGNCIQAAATIVAAMVREGRFKEMTDDAVLNQVKVVARVLRDDAKAFINETKVDAPKPVAEPEGV